MNTAGASRALVGARRLLSWENGTADGDVTHPIGADPLGYLTYTDDDRFSVTRLVASRVGGGHGRRAERVPVLPRKRELLLRVEAALLP